MDRGARCVKLSFLMPWQKLLSALLLSPFCQPALRTAVDPCLLVVPWICSER